MKLRLTREEVEALLEDSLADGRAALVAYTERLCRDWLDMEAALGKRKKANRKLPRGMCDEDLSDK